MSQTTQETGTGQTTPGSGQQAEKSGQQSTQQNGQQNGQTNADHQNGDLGENGRKALQAERDARKELEKQLRDMQTAQTDQMKRLAEAFGIKAGDAKNGKDGSSDVVGQLQEQMAKLQHDKLVLKVAKDHKIIDDDDVALLEDTHSEDAMRKLATRLAKNAGSSGGDGGSGKPTRRQPREDHSQGQGGSGGPKAVGADGLAEAQKRFGTNKQ